MPKGSSEKSRENLKPFVKGQSGNPDGKKVGTRDFKTLFKIAIKRLADKKGITPEQMEEDLITNGVLKGFTDHRWYKDSMDRLHGSAAQKVDVTSGGEKIEGFSYVKPEETK